MWLETPIQDPKHFSFTFRHDPHDFLDHRVIESNFRTGLFQGINGYRSLHPK